MAGFIELLGVVSAGLTARKIRTLLIVLGPLIGVGAIVAAVGLTESQTGALKERLKELGTTLIVAEAGASFGTDPDPRFPEDVNERVNAIPVVESVSGIHQLGGLTVLPHEGALNEFRAVPVPVLVVETNLLDVIQVDMRSGRWINDFDASKPVRVAVIGPDLAERYAYFPNELRTIDIDGFDYAVVGVIDGFAFDPGTFDSAVFVSRAAAEEDFDSDPEPSVLYVRADDGETTRANSALPVAISLGGDTQTATQVPSDLLESEAETDKALRNIVILMGGLALFVGGVGIANVMSISVIQRSSEIGIRRALGHSRLRIGLQFMLESMAVGILGGLLGVLTGAGVVYLISDFQDWVPVLNWPTPFIWLGPAIAISILFGLYPSIRAARLEPLETLRLG